jgi:hypothetical protein
VSDVMSFLVRWGMALAAPRGAMAIADDPGASGRAAGDLARAIVVVVVAAHTRKLVAGMWILFEVGWREAAAVALDGVAAASLLPLIFVLIASLVVSLGAGARRNLGRDFELAAVAALAPVTVMLAADLWSRAIGPLGATGRSIVLGAGLGWGAMLIALAIYTARRRAAPSRAAA